MKKKISLVLALFTSLTVFSQSENLKLWYSKPAKEWVEALPIGNGRLGAMVYGSPNREELQLNELTLWAGGPHRNDNPNALKVLKEVRQLVFEGKNAEAQMLVEKNFRTPRNGMPYQTIGSLFLNFPGHENYTDFYRDLNIENATATTSYRVNGVKYVRQIFASFPDNVIVMCITADKPGAITFTANYKSPLPCKVKKNGQKLILSGRGADHEGVKGVIDFENQAFVKNDGGELLLTDSTLTVTNANSAIVYISAATNFVNYQDVSADQSKRASGYLQKAIEKDFDKALVDHVAFYQNLFNRVKLDLGITPSAKEETDKRIRNFKKGDDPALVTLGFQFGRYLLISCSQPGGQPANLQGLWNHQLLAPWDGKYTININLQMNYWPAEVTNLTELHQPLFQLIKELSETGKETAKTMYGCNGWMAHHNTDIWRITGPTDPAFWSMWPNGGAWLAQHLWQHYQFTGDINFLKEYFPVLKGTADFFLDFLVKHLQYKWMVTCPSNSPEHGPASESFDTPSTIAGCTMDNQIAFDALANTMLANIILGGNKAYTAKLKAMIKQLPPMQIGRYNQLQEWLEDVDNPKSEHRHVSHLYGLFPSSQISPSTQPALFQAAKQSLIYRGDKATGWAIGWKINLWARLLDGNHALSLIKNMLTLVEPGKNDTHTYSNMFDAHPPFQIDGNFGLTSGVSEMLLQSHDGAVQILPALPDVWAKGSVSGLKARGGFEVSIDWDNNQVSKVKVLAANGGNLRLRSYVPLKGAGLKIAKGENPNLIFRTVKGKRPLISKELNSPKMPVLSKVYEYDVTTKAGNEYVFTR